MLLQNNAAYNAAFAGRQGFEAAAYLVDKWEGFEYPLPVESITVTRELEGDLPESATLIGGGVAIKARAALDGADPAAPSPFRRDDRLAVIGAPIRVSAGYSGLPIDLFTGRVREMSKDEAERSAAVDLIDRSDELRAPVTMSAHGSLTGLTTSGVYLRRYPLNLSAVIVAALHKSGRRMTPEPLGSACAFSAPLLFGTLADIGWTTGAGSGVAEGTAWLTPGPFGPAPSAAEATWTVTGHPGRQVAWGNPDEWMRIEAWVNTAGASNLEPLRLKFAGNELRLSVSNTAVSSRLTRAGTTGVTNGPTRTVVAGWRHVAITVAVDGTLRTWVDGTESSASTAAVPTSTPGTVQLDMTLGRVQQVSVHAAATAAALGPLVHNTFTPAGSVDTALLEVDYLPPIDGRAAWAVCQEIAAAELGMVGHDEQGRFYFRNRETINGNTAPVAEWSTDLVDNITATASVDSVRTRVTASVQQAGFNGADIAGPVEHDQVMLDRVLAFPPGTSSHIVTNGKPWFATRSWVKVDIDSGQSLGASGDYSTGMVLCSDPNGNAWWNAGLSVRASVHMMSPTAARLTVANNSGRTLYAVYPREWTPPFYLDIRGGDPACWIASQQFDADARPTVAVDVANAAAIGEWGDRVFELPSSEWLQSATHVRSLANSLLADMDEPRLELSDITVPADLRWQIGDVVKLTDWSGRIPEQRARITRSEVTLSLSVENGASGTYSLRHLPA